MRRLALISLFAALAGCTGAMARKSPQELAATPDAALCAQYFNVTGNAYAANMDMGKQELRVIFAEFQRRGVPPDQITYYCAQPKRP